jgi:hypothetical protein
MTRKLLILALTMMMVMPQVVFASGGANPPPSGAVKLIGPRVQATIVIDPHNACVQNQDSLMGSCWGTVRIERKKQSSAVAFPLPDANSGFSLGLGCQLLNGDGSDLTEARFLYTPLLSWMPADAITNLLAGVGITFSPYDPTFVPMITSIDNAMCTPADPGIGTLSFDAIIEFLVPCGPGTAYKHCPKN